jgi:hypothetical protein
MVMGPKEEPDTKTNSNSKFCDSGCSSTMVEA